MSALHGVRLSITARSGRLFSFLGVNMASVSKKIAFHYDIGDRVWMVCDKSVSGFVTGYIITQGFLPAYIVSCPAEETVCQSYELTADEPVDYPAAED